MNAGLRPLGGPPREVLALVESWVPGGGQPLVVRTSGSTGEPKEVVLSHSAVLANAEAALARLGGPGRWLLALPTSGVAALQVLVRSVLAGYEPVFADEYPELESALAHLGDRPGGERGYVSLVPTQLHRLALAGRLELLAGLDAVLLGGAAVDPELLDRVRAAGVPVVRTYGMSETCGGCVYDGLALDAVRLRIDRVGQVLVAGPVLFDGYGAQPRSGEWFATGDLGHLDNGVLSVHGRIDDVVNSGGVKIALGAVERALGQVADVAAAAAVGIADLEWGSRVVAFVVPADAVCLDGLRVEALRDAVTELGLDRRWAPRQVQLVDELPLLPGGKVDRRALRDRAAQLWG